MKKILLLIALLFSLTSYGQLTYNQYVQKVNTEVISKTNQPRSIRTDTLGYLYLNLIDYTKHALDSSLAVDTNSFAKLGGNNAQVIIGSKTSNSVSIITKNTQKVYIDSASNVFIGTNGGFSLSGTVTNNFAIGDRNTFKGISGTRDNNLIGSRNDLGDSTNTIVYAQWLGSSNTMINNGHPIWYSHVFGTSNKIYAKTDNFIPTWTIGFSNTDSLNNQGKNFSSWIMGNYWKNRNSLNAFIGTFSDSAGGSTILGYTSTEDGEMVIASPKKIKLSTGAKRNNFWMFPDGSITIGDTVRHGYKIDVTGTANITSNATIGGKAFIRSLNISHDTTVSGNYSVPFDMDYVGVNTSSGSRTITLTTSSYSAGKIICVKKKSTDTNTISIVTTSGTLDGGSSYTIATGYQAVKIRLNSDGNYDIYPFGSSDGKSAFLSQFGVVADLKRSVFSFTNGSHTINSVYGIFKSSDIGKVIVLHGAKSYPAYTSKPLTLTATITAYTNSSTVTIDSTPSLSGTDSIGYYFTNQCDNIQNAITICNTLGIGTLWNDVVGSIGICPKLSTVVNAQSPANRGFQINNDLAFRGSNREGCKIKLSLEDDVSIDTTAAYLWNGFRQVDTGDVHIWDMTLLAPDRYTLDFIHENPIAASTASNNITGAFNINRVDFKGDAAAKNFNPAWDRQWAMAYTGSPQVGANGTYYVYVNDVNIYSDFQWISFFPDSGGKQTGFFPTNVNAYYSGSHSASQTFANAATVTNGNDTVTIDTSKFSVWFMRKYDGINYNYSFTITDGVNTWNGTVKKALSANKFVATAAAPNIFTNASFSPTYLEGEGFYVHDNVNTFAKYLNMYGAGKVCWHLYSAGGTPGDAQYHLYDHTNVYSYNGYNGGSGIIIAHNSNSQNIIRDCDSFSQYNIGYSANYDAWNTNCSQCYVYAKSNLHNCSGNISIANGGVGKLYGGNYNSVYLTSTGDSALVYGNSVISITNSNPDSGYVATYNSTVLETKTGTIHQFPIESDTALLSTKANDNTILAKTITVNGNTQALNTNPSFTVSTGMDTNYLKATFYQVGTNTGLSGRQTIGISNNNSLGIKTNNTERLTLDSNGNLGLNTTAPGTTTIPNINIDANSRGITVHSSSTGSRGIYLALRSLNDANGLDLSADGAGTVYIDNRIADLTAGFTFRNNTSSAANNVLFFAPKGFYLNAPKFYYPTPASMDTSSGTSLFKMTPTSSNRDIGFAINDFTQANGFNALWDASAATLYMDSRSDNTTTPWVFRMRTAGTPVNVMTLLPSGVGINTTPVASAALQISSTTQGFLPPKMTTAQRTAISSPAEGLCVYDTDLHKLYVYDGTTWQAAW